MSGGARTSMLGSKQAVIALIAGHEDAARAGWRAMAVPKPEDAFDQAMELWSLCPDQLLSAPDVVRLREVEQARESWKKLKRRFSR